MDPSTCLICKPGARHILHTAHVKVSIPERARTTLSILLNSSSSGESLESDDTLFSPLLLPSSASDMEVDSCSDSEAGSHPEDLEVNTEALLELFVVIDNSRFISDRFKNLYSKEFADNFFRNVIAPNLFRQIVRMDKATFFLLLDLIEDHPVFQNKALICQAPVSLQLIVCLVRLGHYGNGACNKGTHLLWGVSYGSVQNFTRRCFVALESAIGDGIKWLDHLQRSRISEAFNDKGFPSCIGLIGGTLIPLSQRPKKDGECNFDRKSRYSVNAQVVCDHERKIIFVYTGMPGSCQDITCLKRSSLWDKLQRDDVFDASQYLLGDSGYVATPHLIAAYKVTGNSQDKVDFNTCVAKTRYVNEHAIGILKNRWFSLKELRIHLNQKRDSKYMVRWIMMCALLHNFMLTKNDDWTEEDWIESNNDSEEDQTELDELDLDQTQQRSAEKILLAKVQHKALEFHRKPGGFLCT